MRIWNAFIDVAKLLLQAHVHDSLGWGSLCFHHNLWTWIWCSFRSLGWLSGAPGPIIRPFSCRMQKVASQVSVNKPTHPEFTCACEPQVPSIGSAGYGTSTTALFLCLLTLLVITARKGTLRHKSCRMSLKCERVHKRAGKWLNKEAAGCRMISRGSELPPGYAFLASTGPIAGKDEYNI